MLKTINQISKRLKYVEESLQLNLSIDFIYTLYQN